MISNISRPRDLRKPWNLPEMNGTTHDSLQIYNTYWNILKTHNLRSKEKLKKRNDYHDFSETSTWKHMKKIRQEVSTTCSKT